MDICTLKLKPVSNLFWMKTTDKETWIFLILFMGAILRMGISNTLLCTFGQEVGIRFDLLILPILILSTVYILVKKR